LTPSAKRLLQHYLPIGDIQPKEGQRCLPPLIWIKEAILGLTRVFKKLTRGAKA
jgi:hypothetical protein